jgi:DNA repair exonuclease SbcCD nuclease subunit
MRFIHAADLHIDSPLRGLARYDGAPAERLRSATRRALERLVDLALERRVDFVLLAGDIYDRDWQDFHTGLFFREQMVRLGRGGVRVFIAQGNHDAQGVISRQLALPDNVTVFSHRKAECVVMDEIGVAVHGRSFPDREVAEDLVPSYGAARPGLFNIGVLHTSLTGRPGHDTYAPTRVETLVAAGYDYWALGHVHGREVVRESTPRIVFPGNLQGRHANETGPKGCELVSVEPGGVVAAEFVALDVVRWAQVDVDLGGADSLEIVQQRFHAAVAPLLAAGPEQLHAMRVTLRGSTLLHGVEAMTPGTLAAHVQGAAQDVAQGEVWIEQVRLALSPPIDRADSAERQDAVGELVRLVDSIALDDAELARWGREQLGALMKAGHADLLGADMPALDDPALLRSLLLDGEATVLARMAGAASATGGAGAPKPSGRASRASALSGRGGGSADVDDVRAGEPRDIAPDAA